MEDQALTAFLEAFNDVHGTTYEISRRPDQLNRTAREIDAWAECDDCPPLAIEHTVLPSFAGAYSSGKVFADHVLPLGDELGGIFPDMYQVRVPDEALRPGTDWVALSAAIRGWFMANAGDAPEGWTSFRLQGIAGEFVLQRLQSDLRVACMQRTIPQGDFSVMLRDSIADRLDHKYTELAHYQANGATTVLVLQSHDMSMVNEQILTAALQDVLGNVPHPGLDEIWLVWSIGTSIPLVFCLVGSDAVRASAAERMERLILKGL